MSIFSFEFALFLLAFFPIYWAFRSHPFIQNGLLLISSLFILAIVNINFAIAITLYAIFISVISFFISISKSQLAKKVWLGLGILGGVAHLSFYKYADFFITDLQQFLNDDSLVILMPLGISYYTFQSITYLIGVYKTPTAKFNFFETLLYFSFFPTITSGPIARFNDFKSIYGINTGMFGQIKTAEPRNIVQPSIALLLILSGIFKKWVLAGSFAAWINPIFNNPMQYDSFSVLFAIFGYTLQLFTDFSGYSDLAIGIAMLLGFKLPYNFKMPLLAVNLRDFWNRWHISLSTWIRDYIYIPLGGSQKGFIRTQINLFIAFFLSGIWHGYGLNFALWGSLHARGLILLNILDKLFGKSLLTRFFIGKILGFAITFTFVAITFVIFRSNDLSDAILVFDAFINNQIGWIKPDFVLLSVFISTAIYFALYPFIEKTFKKMLPLLSNTSLLVIAQIFLVLFFVIFIIAPEGIPEFIYANF